MKIQNKKSKAVTTMMSIMVIGFMLFTPTTVIPNVGAVNDVKDTSVPQPVIDWFSTHPHFSGCVGGNLKTHIAKEESCIHPEIAASGQPSIRTNPTPASQDYSYTAVHLDCSSTCFAGAQFYTNGPYNKILSNGNIGSTPTNIPYDFSYWEGLNNCQYGSCTTSNAFLVQSGWKYSTATGTNPAMFAEIVGPFTWGGVDCSANFCGAIHMNKQANDPLYMNNYAYDTQNEWVAYVQDNRDSDYIFFAVPYSTTITAHSLPYAITSMEVKQVPNTSFFPTAPISFTGVTLYKPSVGQVPTDTNIMYSFDGPTLSSGGIPQVTYSATGSPTATVQNSY